MSRSDETLYRQWVMLARIPRYPRKTTVAELKSILNGEGYRIDTRTVQRDLNKLSISFPLSNDLQGRKQFWYWIEEAAIQDLPGMEPVTALAFEMAESYLTPLLPQVTLDLIQPYFKRAKKVLGEHSESKLRTWPSKVSVIKRGPALLKPHINENVQQLIYQSLLDEFAITAQYKARDAQESKQYEMHPLGIVSRMSVLYLVCTLWDYHDIKQFALHRFISAEKSALPYQAQQDFSLQAYTKEQHQFSYPTTQEPIQLKVLFENNIAKHLAETPLNEEQKLTPQDENWTLLETNIHETLELRWWLQGFGDNIEVLEPASLREKFKQVATNINQIYSSK